MKTIAAICNLLAWFATCFVLVTDGVPASWAYVLFSVALVLVPLVTLFVLVPEATSRAGRVLAKPVAVANLVLLASVGWALVDQYPHPNEQGFLLYVALIILAPTISAVVLLRFSPSRPEATA